MDFVIENGILKKYQGTDKNVIIPDGVKSIAKGAFYNCKTVTHITIPNSVEMINGDITEKELCWLHDEIKEEIDKIYEDMDSASLAEDYYSYKHSHSGQR